MGTAIWDALHKAFGFTTDLDVYFTDIYFDAGSAPGNERPPKTPTGLLRQPFLYVTDLNVHGPEDFKFVVQKHDGRPRKTLDWDTSAERLA